MKDVLLLL